MENVYIRTSQYQLFPCRQFLFSITKTRLFAAKRNVILKTRSFARGNMRMKKLFKLTLSERISHLSKLPPASLLQLYFNLIFILLAWYILYLFNWWLRWKVRRSLFGKLLPTRAFLAVFGTNSSYRCVKLTCVQASSHRLRIAKIVGFIVFVLILISSPIFCKKSLFTCIEPLSHDSFLTKLLFLAQPYFSLLCFNNESNDVYCT